MENVCRNCKFGKSLDMKFIDTSLKAQAEVERAVAKLIEPLIKDGKEISKEVSKKLRLEAIEKVVTSPAYKEHIKIYGALSMSKKKTDIDGAYIKCALENHLSDEDVNEKTNRTTKRKPYVRDNKAGIVHKYYFSCLHFEGR